ncbi:MAG TPA: 2-amino-4-hydroxy-6-hydroxymethyldihydropteridine diphosphokinase [Bacteroidales bacterium]|nr:2-amino-4-hydroxy-6-hydroxymethyldihydropteridine diphosphokinase [Bacteroidales bacterium]HSA44295.1 2-amino-4-hydroxy-6-hydroxymethyldihydropteridine diphosphokinase [Bacteroidales bacterium]
MIQQPLPSRVLLCLGSNLGDREQMLAAARRGIVQGIGRISGTSSVYETRPWGFDAGTSFLNQVVRVETFLSPEAVLEEIRRIEKRHGRERHGQAGYQSRTLDIDILYFDDLMITTGTLTIPHPLLHLRKFVLEPLAEIDPAFIHPVLGLSNRELLAACQDESDVTHVKPIEDEQITTL